MLYRVDRTQAALLARILKSLPCAVFMQELLQPLHSHHQLPGIYCSADDDREATSATNSSWGVEQQYKDQCLISCTFMAWRRGRKGL